MATTTNFGWTTPDDTALVKDGASAIRTLGSAIDTSMMDLKGGTTGQVLSKNSNTDMDFTWVAQDDSNAIQNAIVDAKGDLITATAADTPSRIAVGTNGQILTADSTTATGLKWADSSSGSLTLLSTTTMSGASTTVSSIDQTYTHLFFELYGITNTTATTYRIRPNSSSTNVSNVGMYNNASVDYNSGVDIRITNSGTIPTTGGDNAFSGYFYNYAVTNHYRNFMVIGSYFNGSAAVATFNAGGYNTSTAITSIQIVAVAGSMNGGTLKIYGVK